MALNQREYSFLEAHLVAFLQAGNKRSGKNDRVEAVLSLIPRPILEDIYDLLVDEAKNIRDKEIVRLESEKSLIPARKKPKPSVSLRRGSDGV